MTPSLTIMNALHRLDRWFQTMRGPGGIGGPVAHWWESSLLYTGPMIDWRYEGLLTGYVELYRKTLNDYWLERAVEAANDVCQAQLPNGKFWNSSFQIGALEGGTPHESAVVVGLFELAQVLREHRDDRWVRYFQAGERNLRDFQLRELWSEERQAFCDQPGSSTFVPNKNGTMMEALILYETLSGADYSRHIVGAARLLLSAQIKPPHPAAGATIHLGTGAQQLAIGIYTARNVGALLRLYRRSPQPEFLDAAVAMGQFLTQLVGDHGTAFGYDRNGRLIHCPTWISPSGDFLRAFVALQPYDPTMHVWSEHVAALLLNQQTASGALPTARGLGAKGSTRLPTSVPDFRDVLPVAGWCDKTFRGLALYLNEMESPSQSTVPTDDVQIDCRWQGQPCVFVETPNELLLSAKRSGRALYRWHKGAHFPTHFSL